MKGRKNIKVIRYSINGFNPQKQTYHLEHDIYFHLYNWDDFINSEEMQLYKHLIPELESNHRKLYEFYKENFDDFKYGVWVFWDGCKNQLELNHLKRKVPCWEAELPYDIEVYDCNLESKRILCDPFVSMGCYVPERSLKEIKNIRKQKR